MHISFYPQADSSYHNNRFQIILHCTKATTEVNFLNMQFALCETLIQAIRVKGTENAGNYEEYGCII